MKMKISVLALLTGMALSGCAPHQTTSSSPAVQPLAPAAQSDSVVKRQLAYGLYEMALTPGGVALYVACAESFNDVQGGVVYKLDAKTLKTLGTTHTDLKNFAMQASADGKTLYVSNSLDGGISAIGAADGKVKGRLLFSERNEKGLPYGARQILAHNNTLYVGAVADPAQI